MNSGKTRNSAETAEGNLLINELARNLFVHAGSNLMVRRSVVEEIGGFDESFTRNQDIEFLIKILKRYKLAFVDCVGLKVYLHDRGNIDYDDLTEKFVNTFSKEIGEQSERDQKAIYKMLSLQRIRASVSKRDFRNAYMIKKDTNISTQIASSSWTPSGRKTGSILATVLVEASDSTKIGASAAA